MITNNIINRIKNLERIVKLNCKFKIEKDIKEHEMYITKEFGFKDFAITDFIKSTKTFLKDNGCKNMLDIGCGNGRHSIYFNENGFEVYSCDINCNRINDNLKGLNIKNIDVSCSSFTDLPYDDNFFDTVICMSTLHHAVYKDIKKGISEIYRVLKPHGYFIFDFLSRKDESYRLGIKIEDNTFIGSRSGEENVPHHYTDENELKTLLSSFSNADIVSRTYYFFDSKMNKYTSKVFDVTAFK